jgi:hypothetical protein
MSTNSIIHIELHRGFLRNLYAIAVYLALSM